MMTQCGMMVRLNAMRAEPLANRGSLSGSRRDFLTPRAIGGAAAAWKAPGSLPAANQSSAGATAESGTSGASFQWPQGRGRLQTGFAPHADPAVEWSET